MNRQIPILFFLLTALLFGCTPKKEAAFIPTANTLTVTHSIQPDTLFVGDHVQLVLTTYFPSNGVINLPEIGREKDLVLLNRTYKRIPREDALTQTETHYTLTSFRVGEQIVSTNTITCNVGDEILSVPFPKILLQVESSLTNELNTAIADIKPVQKLPGRIPRWIWFVLGAGTLAFLAGFLVSKFWKHRESILPSAPLIPPHIIAFQALEFLQNKGLLEKNACDPFYTELSLILRTYLEGRFNLNAPDETTEELVIEMSQSPQLNKAQHQILRTFMQQADIVKFAKGNPDRDTMETAFETTKQFITETAKEPTAET